MRWNERASHLLRRHDREKDGLPPFAMTPLIYRCPDKGLKVQTWLPDDRLADNRRADDPTESGAGRIATVNCLICARRHLVDCRTGQVVGEGQ
jgi:hypothetical protein